MGAFVLFMNECIQMLFLHTQSLKVTHFVYRYLLSDFCRIRLCHRNRRDDATHWLGRRNRLENVDEFQSVIRQSSLTP